MHCYCLYLFMIGHHISLHLRAAVGGGADMSKGLRCWRLLVAVPTCRESRLVLDSLVP